MSNNSEVAMPQHKGGACLRGVSVLCTGFPDQTRQELQQLVVDLGGSCILDCSVYPEPDVLVASSVLSSKYKVTAIDIWLVCRASSLSNTPLVQATVASQPDIPTLTAGWLRACEQSGSKASAA